MQRASRRSATRHSLPPAELPAAEPAPELLLANVEPAGVDADGEANAEDAARALVLALAGADAELIANPEEGVEEDELGYNSDDIAILNVDLDEKAILKQLLEEKKLEASCALDMMREAKDEAFLQKAMLVEEINKHIETKKSLAKMTLANRKALADIHLLHTKGLQAAAAMTARQEDEEKKTAAAWTTWKRRGGADTMTLDYPLKVTFAEKEAVKALGAHWKPEPVKRWVVPKGVLLHPFARFLV